MWHKRQIEKFGWKNITDTVPKHDGCIEVWMKKDEWARIYFEKNDFQFYPVMGIYCKDEIEAIYETAKQIKEESDDRTLKGNNV